MLNNTSVTTLAELSGYSKAYISQVKGGQRPPSEGLIQTLADIIPGKEKRENRQQEIQKALQAFLKSRREGISPNTIRDYRITLGKALPALGLRPTTADINRYLNNLGCTLGGKYGYYKNIRAFYNWLYSPRSGYPFDPNDNPVTWVDAPKRPVLILPSLSQQLVKELIQKVDNLRDKAIIALFTESGLRLVELVAVRQCDIDWENRIIRTLGKGNKEAYATFGAMSEQYLKQWLAEYQPNGGNLWGLNKWGVVSMLRRLEKKTGLPCNPHTFRRTFACLLRKAGVDTMTIKDLGRWESLEMVQRYTRSVTFHDSLALYQAPLG